MADTINFTIVGDVVGRDNIKTDGSGESGDVTAQDIVAAKLKAKLEEIKREAEDDARSISGGDVTISGVNINIGGRVVSGDLTEEK